MSAARRALVCALVALAALVPLLATGAGAGAAQPEEPGKVLIVSLPAVRWEDISDHDLPHIEELVRRSAVASMSVRTIGPISGLGDAYTTLGAGNRAGASTTVAGRAYGPDEPLEAGTAGEAFERRMGVPTEGAAVVHVEMARIDRRADGMRYGAEPGALGEALRDAGLRAAVVANADEPEEAAENGAEAAVDATSVDRPAALALVDRAGRVDDGSVSPELLTPDPATAFGVRLDRSAVADATRAALEDADVVLVEASDLARLDAAKPRMTADAYDAARDRALADADDLVGDLAGAVDPERDLLMLVGPTSPGAMTGSQEQLTAFALSGAGVEPGLARSGTTRRAGYVTLTDVAPTVLRHLDVDLPDSMAGTAITSAGGDAPTAETIDDLVGINDVATFRDRAVGPVSVLYIVLQVLVYGVAVLALRAGRHRPKLRRAALAGSLVVLAFPAVVFLSGLLPYDDLSVGAYVLVVLGASAVLAGIARLVAFRHLLGPPLVLIGLNLLIMLADVATGGRLQINTVFGYSPVVAGRFAGFGNLSFALTAIAAIAVATGVWAWPRLHGPYGEVDASLGRRGWPLGLAAAILAVTLIFDGLPSIGSDVGGVLAAGPAFAVVLLLLAGVRVQLRTLVAIGVGTLAVLGAFAALDLTRPAEQRTHLGRFVESVTDGGAGTVVARKLESNASILTSSVWTWVIPAGLLFLMFLTWRSQGLLQHLQERVPGLRAFLVGGLVAAALGLAVNDSGVAIPAMMFGVALPYVTYLIIRTADRPAAAAGDGATAEAGAGRPPAGEGAEGAEGAHAGAGTQAEEGGEPPDRRLGERPVPGGTSSAGVR
jgi:hypothetical protein